METNTLQIAPEVSVSSNFIYLFIIYLFPLVKLIDFVSCTGAVWKTYSNIDDVIKLIHRSGEKLFNLFTDNQLISKIYKNHLMLNTGASSQIETSHTNIWAQRKRNLMNSSCILT